MQDPTTMPVIFFGHGNPMNAIEDNPWARAWSAIGSALPLPKGILSISAHWYLPLTAVTAMQEPRTIHDFGGYPRSLFEVQYPAPGSPDLAQRVADLLAPTQVAMDDRWGIDHGTWSVLAHAWPEANIPVVQLSIDETRSTEWHYTLAKRLAPLREEGILIMGSGNLVHNLHTYAWGERAAKPYEWAVRFESMAREQLERGAFGPLIAYETLGRDAMLAAPTPDHYLPLIYVLAQYRQGEAVHFPVEGFDGGSISMLSVQFG